MAFTRELHNLKRHHLLHNPTQRSVTPPSFTHPLSLEECCLIFRTRCWWQTGGGCGVCRKLGLGKVGQRQPPDRRLGQFCSRPGSKTGPRPATPPAPTTATPFQRQQTAAAARAGGKLLLNTWQSCLGTTEAIFGPKIGQHLPSPAHRGSRPSISLCSTFTREIFLSLG